LGENNVCATCEVLAAPYMRYRNSNHTTPKYTVCYGYGADRIWFRTNGVQLLKTLFNLIVHQTFFMKIPAEYIKLLEVHESLIETSEPKSIG
jgi:hypothetical protein